MRDTLSATGYRWRDKDPIIDLIHTLIDDSKMSVQSIAEKSGVSAGTIRNWIGGKTKKPQAVTAKHVLHAIGYDLAVQHRYQKTVLLVPINPRTNEAVTNG